MQFKIKNTDVKISFSFFAVYLIFLCTGKGKIFLITFVTALIHELIHIQFIYLFGASVSEISLSLFGATIKRCSDSEISNIKEAVINYSAPITNVVIGVVSVLLGGESTWATVNIITGLFNLLPFYFFDGGRGLYFSLSAMFSDRTCERILTVTSVIITVVFCFFAVYIFFAKDRNFLYILLSIYMIFAVTTGIFSAEKRF